jgi:hypothetical protein
LSAGATGLEVIEGVRVAEGGVVGLGILVEETVARGVGFGVAVHPTRKATAEMNKVL